MKKRKKLLRKVHNFILKTITAAAVLAMFGSVLSMELISQMHVAYIIWAFSVAWIMIFGHANGFIYE